MSDEKIADLNECTCAAKDMPFGRCCKAAQPAPVDGDYQDIAEFLHTIGWRSTGDAQWTGLRDALPQLRAMLAAAPTLPQSEDARGAEPGTDAARYARLRIIGAAPYGTEQLDRGTVLRFQALDDFLDRDIKTHKSRGEVAQSNAKDAAIALWNNCGEQLQQADDTLRSISSYLGQGGMWDTENLDYAEVEKRIKEGIDSVVDIERKRAASGLLSEKVEPVSPTDPYQQARAEGFAEAKKLAKEIVEQHFDWAEHTCEMVVADIDALQPTSTPSQDTVNSTRYSRADLLEMLPSERDCCGTFEGSPHRATCSRSRRLHNREG